MVSTTIYINAPLSIYPSSVSKTEFLAAVLNIYAVKAEDLFCWKKGTGAAETMLYQSRIGRARMETRSSKEHMRCTCVCFLFFLCLKRCTAVDVSREVGAA